MTLSFYLKRTPFIYLLISFSSFSQVKGDYIFRTDFDPLDQQLYLGGNKSIHLFNQDGNYFMDVRKSDTLYCPAFQPPVDPDKDFIMAASLKSVYGNSSFGIYFGDDEAVKNAFLIYNRGGYEIYKQNGKESGLVSGPSPTPFINKDMFNALLVEKIGNTVYFFINYKFVASVPFSSFKGRSYGLFIPGGQQIACDYFYVKQKRGPINLIENHQAFGTPQKFDLSASNGFAQSHPIISADGEILYYTSVATEKGDNIFRSVSCKRTKKGSWGKAQVLSLSNREKNISVVGLSSDKNEVLVSSGLAFSRSSRLRNGWSTPKNLVFKSAYNSSNVDIGVSPSGDFKTLIMALEEKDSYGVTDLYVSFLRDSVWTTPFNLGKNINTFGDEVSPFLAPDNKTLYFASDGWPGYGRYDIFMSKRLDDSWTRWSEPKNLGPMINTISSDIYYNTSASGDEAFLSRSTREDNYFHIYSITQPNSAAPEPIVLIKGRVLDSESGEPISATITYSIVGRLKSVGSVQSNKHNGTFAISLTKDKQYVFSVHKKGFIQDKRSASTLDLREYRAEELELKLTSFKRGATVIMHNLFFGNNQSNLLPESEIELSRLYSLFIENRSLKIEISGHTQMNNLSEKFNYDLSASRATAVKDYLVKKGVSPERIITKGYGNSHPIEKEKMDEVSQAKNRRVEFKIIDY